ncbi:MAG: hypothetical protein IJ228_00665 [Succinivibrio sp.]|nr:hypothetical protein [Succinivibrio sp.]
MSFKEILAGDLNTFVNPDEFADPCVFNLGGEDVTINALVDSSVVDDFAGAKVRGVYANTVTVYIRQGDLRPLPPVGSVLKLDGQSYFCRDQRIEQGLDVLVLERKLQ